jgi:hypothetical protein
MMAESRSQAEWSRTSAIMCLIANVNRDPKRKSTPYKPSDFNPYIASSQSKPKLMAKVKMSEVKDLLMGLAGKASVTKTERIKQG